MTNGVDYVANQGTFTIAGYTFTLTAIEAAVLPSHDPILIFNLLDSDADGATASINNNVLTVRLRASGETATTVEQLKDALDGLTNFGATTNATLTDTITALGNYTQTAAGSNATSAVELIILVLIIPLQ